MNALNVGRRTKPLNLRSQARSIVVENAELQLLFYRLSIHKVE